MVQMAGFQETLRRLAMIDEGFVEDQAGVGLCLTRTAALDPKTAALLQLGAAVAIGLSSASVMGPVEGFSAMSMGPPGRQ